MKINQRLTLCFSLLFCLLSISYASAQQLNISGVIISSEDNEPLIGATVSVKGNPTKGVITDINGQFQLSVETGTKMLVVSYVGMKTQEIRVPRKEKELKIVLIPETMDIDEVVVTGYGNFSKSSFTGSANTLRTDMLKEVPVMSVEQKLQGMTTGVQITSSSGQPGANQSIRIRGMGSFNASQEPLFVIDGVPVTSGSMSSGGPDAAYMNNSKTNIMSTLNPSDIENVTVIKDAAAASLYGSRAANGVILITTKKGNTGKVRVDLNVSGGFSHAAVDFRPTLNGDQREELLYEGLLNYAIDNGMESPSEYANSNIGTYAYKPSMGYTDWRKELLRTAMHQSYEASVSGGNDRSTFYASLGYNNQEGLAKNSSLDRYSARLNVTQKVGKYGEVGANMMFSQMNQEMNEERGSSINPFLCVAMTMTPSMVVRDEEGNYVGAYDGTSLNPLRDILTDYNRVRMTRMFSTGYAAIEPIKGLKLKETLSYDYTIQKDSRYYNPLSSAGPKSGSDAQTAKGFIEYGKLISSTSLNYVRTFARKHHLDVLAAYEIESYQTDHASGEKSKLPSDKLTEPDNAAVLNSFKSATQAYRMISYLSRLNYDYDDRYYIAGSYRRDGSSRLSPNNRWGNFWSLGTSWRIDREEFMASTSDWLSALTLKMSYGAQGNDNLGTYYASKGLYTIVSNLGENALVSDRMATPNLKWETNLNFNVGIDFSLFNNRFSGSFDFFTRRSKDLLYSRPIAPSLGYGSIDENVGALKNTGIEMVLNGTIINQNGWVWKLGMNLTHYKNKVTDLPLKDMPRSGVNKLQVGRSVYDFYMIEWAGVDPENGDPLWYMDEEDENHNPTGKRVTTNDYGSADYYYVNKSSLPKVYGGFNTSLSWKGFDLSAIFAYSIGGYIYNRDITMILHNGSLEGRDWSTEILKRWTPDNRNTDVPALSTTTNNWNSASTRFLQNNSYMRLKNLTLSYNLPKQWISKLSLSSVQVYVQGDNLFTIHRNQGLDPEQGITGITYYRYPAMRTISGGINLSF